MEGHEIIWDSLSRTTIWSGFALLWCFSLTAVAIGLAAIADKYNERIKRLESFLKDDMEQEEIMNG